MKQIITLFALLLPILGYSQIEVQSVTKTQSVTVGKCNAGMAMHAELTYNIYSGDTIYFFMFRNAKYSSIIDYQGVTFSGKGNTCEEFYKILLSVFKDENKSNSDYSVFFKLGKESVSVSNFKMMGMTSCRFGTDLGYIYLTPKQINKVFGKN